MTELKRPPLTLVNITQVSEMLGRTEASLRWMMHRGMAPKSALIGGRRMFRLEGEDGVLAWIDAQFDSSTERIA